MYPPGGFTYFFSFHRVGRFSQRSLTLASPGVIWIFWPLAVTFASSDFFVNKLLTCLWAVEASWPMIDAKQLKEFWLPPQGVSKSTLRCCYLERCCSSSGKSAPRLCSFLCLGCQCGCLAWQSRGQLRENGFKEIQSARSGTFKSIHIIVNWNRRSVLDGVYKQTAFQPRAKGGFIMVQLTLVGVDATALHNDLWLVRR